MSQSSHDLDQQKVRGICGVEHSGLAYDTRYLRISAVSNSNQLNAADTSGLLELGPSFSSVATAGTVWLFSTRET
jgi:hypothetical protein